MLPVIFYANIANPSGEKKSRLKFKPSLYLLAIFFIFANVCNINLFMLSLQLFLNIKKRDEFLF